MQRQLAVNYTLGRTGLATVAINRPHTRAYHLAALDPSQGRAWIGCRRGWRCRSWAEGLPRIARIGRIGEGREKISEISEICGLCGGILADDALPLEGGGAEVDKQCQAQAGGGDTLSCEG